MVCFVNWFSHGVGSLSETPSDNLKILMINNNKPVFNRDLTLLSTLSKRCPVISSRQTCFAACVDALEAAILNTSMSTEGGIS